MEITDVLQWMQQNSATATAALAGVAGLLAGVGRVVDAARLLGQKLSREQLPVAPAPAALPAPLTPPLAAAPAESLAAEAREIAMLGDLLRWHSSQPTDCVLRDFTKPSPTKALLAEVAKYEEQQQRCVKDELRELAEGIVANQRHAGGQEFCRRRIFESLGS
jgi:hypothetical protein